MQTYETLFVAVPNLAEEDETATVDALTAVVTDGGGELVTADRMGRRRLAYPIQKHEDGVYVRLLYDSDTAVPKELERRARLSDKVLRTLTVRLTEEWAVDAKKQVVIDAQRKAEAEEKARLEAEEKAKAEAEAAAAAEAEAEAAEAAPAETPSDETPAEAATPGGEGDDQPAAAEAEAADTEAETKE